MTKRERVMAAVEGRPVDRVPFSLWYHFRLDPPAGEGMAQAELEFYRKYSPDLFKVMHDIPYEMPPDRPQIEQSNDWRRLPVLDGKSGNFGDRSVVVVHVIKLATYWIVGEVNVGRYIHRSDVVDYVEF